MIRRLARFVQDNDLGGISSILVLMFREDYHNKSTKEMMDRLEDVQFKVDKIICNAAESQ